MNDKTCHHHNHGSHHVNGFIDLNGIPYILGEYLEKRNFNQVDRSMLGSEVNVDTSEPMRSIVDIRIDDIGKRSDGQFPAVLGNATKFENLLNMLKTYIASGNRELNVLRKGIVIRVNYQLENATTGSVIRTMTEDYRIRNRDCYIDINPNDINNNSIVSNFSDTMASTIDQFTHGNDRMVLRITGLQMFYELVQQKPAILDGITSGQTRTPMPTIYGNEEEIYKYHIGMQHHQYVGHQGIPEYGLRLGDIIPPNWLAFNAFYHFDKFGYDINLHMQEIEDPRFKVSLVAAGTVNINRSFAINPGSRIIFKFSIWKNDLTVVNDVVQIAKVLQIPIMTHQHDDHHHCEDHHDHCINPDHETLVRLYNELEVMYLRQNGVINYMMTKIDTLSNQIASLLTPVEEAPSTGNDTNEENPSETPSTSTEETPSTNENTANVPATSDEASQ